MPLPGEVSENGRLRTGPRQVRHRRGPPSRVPPGLVFYNSSHNQRLTLAPSPRVVRHSERLQTVGVSLSAKFPRIPHLPWSPGASRDELVLPDPPPLEGRAMIGSETLDFENRCQSACLLLSWCRTLKVHVGCRGPPRRFGHWCCCLASCPRRRGPCCPPWSLPVRSGPGRG